MFKNFVSAVKANQKEIIEKGLIVAGTAVAITLAYVVLGKTNLNEAIDVGTKVMGAEDVIVAE